MKKLIILSFCIFSFSFGYAQSGKELDNENGTSMMPIVDGMNDVIKVLEEKKLEIVHIEFDLLFQDRDKEIIRNLSAGYKYSFLAYGDYRIKQVGLNLYKEENGVWKYIKTGDVSNGATTLIIDVEETAKYKIVLIGGEFADEYKAGHYGIFIMHN